MLVCMMCAYVYICIKFCLCACMHVVCNHVCAACIYACMWNINCEYINTLYIVMSTNEMR